MKKDNDAVNAIVGWLDEVNPFDSTRDRKTLVSFSTGFSSTPGDSVNSDKAEEVGRDMQEKMDGKTVLDAMEIKYKVKSLASFRSGPYVNGEKMVIDPLKFFNRLIIACEREVKIKDAMRFELTPTPMSLFDSNQMMRKPDKAALARFLKASVDPIENPPATSLVIDGGWLLHSVRWEANVTWKDIAESYLRFVKLISSQHLRITVVFDGYHASTKDHEHLRRTKKACCDILIRPDIKIIVPREKFLDNKNNKAQLVLLLAETFKRSGISVLQCSNDADTSIVQVALDEARESPVEVRAEDTDIMVMLVHHATNHTIFLTTAKNTSYDIGKMQEAVPERYRKYLIFLHSFSGCDTVSAIYGFSKPTLLSKLCKTDKAERAMDVFLNTRALKGDIIKAGCEVFKLMYHGNQPKDLEELRFDIFSKRATAGSIKPERLPPTTGAATQHILRAYLQTRDWLLLKTPSLDVLEYGWKLGKQGYAPVPSTDPIAPDYLLKLVSCNCTGDCDTLRCSCKKQGVKCISACGNCHGNFCHNINHLDESSERDAGELDDD